MNWARLREMAKVLTRTLPLVRSRWESAIPRRLARSLGLLSHRG